MNVSIKRLRKQKVRIDRIKTTKIYKILDIKNMK